MNGQRAEAAWVFVTAEAELCLLQSTMHWRFGCCVKLPRTMRCDVASVDARSIVPLGCSGALDKAES
jgi:hypothetical protein